MWQFVEPIYFAICNIWDKLLILGQLIYLNSDVYSSVRTVCTAGHFCQYLQIYYFKLAPSRMYKIYILQLGSNDKKHGFCADAEANATGIGIPVSVFSIRYLLIPIMGLAQPSAYFFIPIPYQRDAVRSGILAFQKISQLQVQVAQLRVQRS